MVKSVLTKDQKKFFRRKFTEDGENYICRVQVRYDDECGNGRNTFAITADIYDGKGKLVAGGCQHEYVEKVFPELKKYIKWHLCGSNEPLYYIANTLWLAQKKQFNLARGSAAWPEATDEDLSQDPDTLKRVLLERLPALMEDFKRDVEELGFVF